MPGGTSHASQRPPLLVIAGPTASGKTEFAMELARQTGGAIVNVDSVQVYRGFDIGSGKPAPSDRAEVSHHLIDILDAPEEIDAMGFAARADATLRELAERGTPAIVTAGTGLWLRALLRGLVPLPAVDAALRARLDAELTEHGAPELFRRVEQIDPITAAQIHPHDAVRIVRALEVHEQTGTALGELRQAHQLGEDRYSATFIVIDEPSDALTKRIEARIDEMLAKGWIEETRDLLARWQGNERAFHSVGYREIVSHLRDGTDIQETRQAIRKATRHYARRQRTWFRSEPGVTLRVTRSGLQERLGTLAEQLLSRSPA